MEKGLQSNASKTLINKCRACGLPIQTADIDKSGGSGKDGCRICTLDYMYRPDFISVVSALMKGIYMEKMGFKNETVALKNAWKEVTEFPYWKKNSSEILSLENIENGFQADFTHARIYSRLMTTFREMENVFCAQEQADIFISHSWNGPDDELVEPLVEKLKNLGYSVWYDKEKGLEPGELMDYLKDAILNSKNCIPIICREFFKSDYTLGELEMLFAVKDKKHVLPVWWEDVDSTFLKQKGSLGESILNSAGITWKNCNRDLDTLVKQLDEYLTANEDMEIYNGVKLFESEAQVMKNLEKLIGASVGGIPILNDNNKDNVDFGFAYEDKHVTELVLRITENGRTIPSLNLPENFDKLRHLQKLNAPLVQIPKRIGNMKSLRVIDIHDGMLESLPSELGDIDLRLLESFNISGNPHLSLSKVGEKAYDVLKWLMKKDNLYQNIPFNVGIKLFFLQIVTGIQEEIPQVKKVESYTFGYVMSDENVTQLSLYEKGISFIPESLISLNSLTTLNLGGNQLSSLPESIGNLKSLDYLNFEENKITSLPGTIGSLKSLTELHLNNNQLLTLPESIGNLTSLTYLTLEKNQLLTLPESIGNLTLLTELNFDENKLSSLPQNIGNLKQLKELWLNNNQLSSLPETIGNLTSLKILKSRWNKLSSLPESIGNMKSLTYLDSSWNKLSSIPESIGKLTALKDLILYKNQLSSLPEKIEKQLTRLKKNGCSIYMDSNQLESPPESADNLTILKDLIEKQLAKTKYGKSLLK